MTLHVFLCSSDHHCGDLLMPRNTESCYKWKTMESSGMCNLSFYLHTVSYRNIGDLPEKEHTLKLSFFLFSPLHWIFCESCPGENISPESLPVLYNKAGDRCRASPPCTTCWTRLHSVCACGLHSSAPHTFSRTQIQRLRSLLNIQFVLVELIMTSIFTRTPNITDPPPGVFNSCSLSFYHQTCWWCAWAVHQTSKTWCWWI